MTDAPVAEPVAAVADPNRPDDPEAVPVREDAPGTAPCKPGRKRKRTGAPDGNRNPMRHGLRGGLLPKGASYIRRECNVLRRLIENAVMERHNGEIPLHAACLIQSAMRWERHSLLAQRWLRLEQDKMDVMERLHYSREICRASDNRDKALQQLGLDRKGERGNLIDALYTQAAIADYTGDEQQTSGEAQHD